MSFFMRFYEIDKSYEIWLNLFDNIFKSFIIMIWNLIITACNSLSTKFNLWLTSIVMNSKSLCYKSTRVLSQNVTKYTHAPTLTHSSRAHNSVMSQSFISLTHLHFMSMTNVKFHFNYVRNVEVVCPKNLNHCMRTN